MAVPLGSGAVPGPKSQSSWAPEPQKPSTPWVAETVTRTFAASAGPNQAASAASSSPCGPLSGLG